MARRGPYEKGEAKRAEILRVALEVFAVEGYRGTSLRKVASACDLSLPGLMHYFDSKEDLLTQVLRVRDETARAQFGEGRLEDHLQVIRDATKTPGLVALFLSLAASAGDREHPAHELFTERYATLRAALTARLQAGMDAGNLRADLPADRLATLLIALVDGIQLQWLSDEGVDMEQPVTDLLQLLAPTRH
ncbi:TetR/AcrR family transcriptional regulator [Streptomyces iconiensis]|uniref:TetR/AcrR family transcriptional regulator n=1 Tax=Streptomyces iconiensis TaxID=1384038 RepID=A0ABT7A860_9ACTN|nr:TetR/AcrR family transcriptional regulator [Streptomyces iconiensis]MDJ1137523.1 TetR/AcrR family transcriptional regulator [Streptomyces iconiensis]